MLVVPVDPSVSKFSVSGTPKLVMLPPFVRASEDCSKYEAKATAMAVTTINKATGRMRVAARSIDFDMGHVLRWVRAIRSGDAGEASEKGDRGQMTFV